MRVAYVSMDPGVPVFGRKGASVHVQAVLRVLAARGDEVHLVTTRAGGAPEPGLAPVRVQELPRSSATSAADRERALRDTDALVPRVLDDLTRDGGLDLVYERYSLWGRAAMTWARDRAVPAVLEVNSPLVEEQARHRVLVDRFGADRVAADAFAAAGTVICVTDPVARWVLGRGTSPERVFTVGNGVDTARVRPAPTPSTMTSPFTVGFVGTLKPWHGVENLIRALAMLRATDRDHHLLLVGDGPQRSALAQLARSLGVDDAVEMTGSVDPDEVPGLLHRMHVAVAPYPSLRDFYFSPLKVFEYLAAGLPVVASALGSMPQALAHGRLGVLVEPGDPAALSQAIAALKADPDRRTRLARAAREAAVREHDWNRVVDRILALSGVLDVAV